jgi:hypothetical protein
LAQDFVLVKLAAKWSILHYVPTAMNSIGGYTYEMRYYKLIENTNKFILDKEHKYFSIPPQGHYEASTPITSRIIHMPSITVVLSSGFQSIQCEID